ncbi:MAG: HNH endonuclease [Acidobacteria bacterium]|nr:HNH endonuclease [Acidobacteriota bacterium]MBS1865285.1 HNH endonuclease [Acidobacteriota bacterium]
MKKKPNAELVWKQMEDVLAPELSFSVIDRAVYSHLLRHSRLEGKHRMRFSICWLARGTRMSEWSARVAVRRLIAEGVLVLIERSCQAHHVVHVRLPHEVRALHSTKRVTSKTTETRRGLDFAETDFLRTQPLRKSIHDREGGRCFYCLRRLTKWNRCLDHVVPMAQSGRNSYRNLVSCCHDCNSRKAERSAEEFLRWLYRERKISSDELSGRLHALDDLAVGKLKPLPRQK